MQIKKEKNVNRILLTGGGTGGSVSPLLALAEALKKIPPTPFNKGGATEKPPLVKGAKGDFDFLFVGTKVGPEKKMVEEKGTKFKTICSGKFRRYISLRNLIDPFFILIGFFQSIAILLVWRPKLVISAGSFVSVPVIWVAWILRVPVLIHQQDARPGLANKLMAKFAKTITVTFEESLKYYGKKAIWTGNPARRSLEITNDKLQMTNKFGFKNNLPVVLIMGGGTGAMAINELVWKSLGELIKFCQIIHVTGKGKNKGDPISKSEIGSPRSHNYSSFEFLDAKQMAEAYASADIVVSRCGLGTLTELSYLGKPSIIIPMPDSHQEENAKIFKEKEAAIVLNQKKLTPEILTDNIKKLLDDDVLRSMLRNNIQKVMKRGANEKIINIIHEIL